MVIPAYYLSNKLTALLLFSSKRELFTCFKNRQTKEPFIYTTSTMLKVEMLVKAFKCQTFQMQLSSNDTINKT